MAKHTWESSNFCPEETVHLLGSPSNTYAVDVRGDCGSSTTGATYRHDSVQIQISKNHMHARQPTSPYCKMEPKNKKHGRALTTEGLARHMPS
ncbi:wall-associated receptor kinase 3 [Prunus yedoensis var. nudiflora]|uniref:Wall-associated receptor kinase 3 n=1 Tax=Prunus yedoensis var. nudiflora TaxID=2094558 RepID=A0A314V003_PRUYE|nr:wall-associated receptor kinase 3 [Prunus yedoensis var. nudiflora]